MRHVENLLFVTIILFNYPLKAQTLSWQELPSPKAAVWCLESFDNQLYAGYIGLGVLRSKNEGLSWDTLNNGLEDRSITDFLPSAGKEIYVATLLKGVFYSNNAGERWLPFNKGLDASLTFCLLQKGNQLYAGTSQGVYTASVKEGTWTKLTLPKTSAPNQMVTCLYQSGNTLYAGSSKSLYLSEDGGKIWREIPNVTKYQITAITEYKGKLLLATSGNGIVETDLKANTLSKSPEFVGPDTTIIINTMLLTSEGVLLKGSNRLGIFQSDSTLNRGLQDYEIKTIIEHKKQLFAGTYRQGVVVFKDKDKLAPGVQLARLNTDAKLDLELSPNPSTHRVKINFVVGGEETQQLTCVLLSSEGRLVKNIARKEIYPPGQYSLDIDVQRLAAGIYYCTISNQSGNLKASRQLIVNH